MEPLPPTRTDAHSGARVELTVTYSDGSVYWAETVSKDGMLGAADLLERASSVLIGALRSVGGSGVSQ